MDARKLITASAAIMEAIQARGLTNEPEYRYKIGMVVHNLEALLSAVELWKVTENDQYLNAIIMQYNEVGELINRIISEGALPVDFIEPLRQRPLPKVGRSARLLARAAGRKGADSPGMSIWSFALFLSLLS